MKQPAKRASKALQTKIGKAIPRSAKTDFFLQAVQAKTGPKPMVKNTGKTGRKPPGNQRFSHRFVTTADAKIPLSVVQVKREPQDVVFSSRYLAPSSATPDFRCAKPKITASSSIFRVQNPA
jgi:hypothetical protein